MRFFIPTLAGAIAILSVVSAVPAPPPGADNDAIQEPGSTPSDTRQDAPEQVSLPLRPVPPNYIDIKFMYFLRENYGEDFANCMEVVSQHDDANGSLPKAGDGVAQRFLHDHPPAGNSVFDLLQPLRIFSGHTSQPSKDFEVIYKRLTTFPSKVLEYCEQTFIQKNAPEKSASGSDTAAPASGGRI
ncbi:hypothetical protein K492DRAFT_193371 [Lichtheimia hyalospora FSU 10163]|nr:hypothetical protein K492DRAFT_193371 [Lichtheimia hyalospora FSU 10163]